MSENLDPKGLERTGGLIVDKDSCYTEIGYLNDHKIAVATDVLGSQIIYGGPKDSIHLLSEDLGSHEVACIKAKEVMLKGLHIIDWQKPVNDLLVLFSKLYERERIPHLNVPYLEDV
jgi:hypothetical protein